MSLAGVLACVASGCREPLPPPVEESEGTSGGTQRCREMIDNVMYGVHPDRLGHETDPDTAIALLNDWISGCRPDFEPGSLSPIVRDLLAPMLTEDEIELLEAKRFTNRDVRHVRDAMLCGRTVDFVLGTETDDLERVTSLFRYVVRTVAPRSPAEVDVPLTPYEVVFFGRGSAEDRALLFVEILRQFRIDAVILRGPDAPMDSPNASPGRLVGVLLDGKTYLYDAALGVAVPPPDDDGRAPFVARPATLAEVLEHPETLERLTTDEDRPYPLTADDLRRPQVEIVGTSSLWAPRMGELQSVLTGDRALVIFDPLVGDAEVGTLARVTQAARGHWEREDVAIWSYPESQAQEYERADRRQRQAISALWRPFDVSLATVSSEEGEVPRARERIQFVSRAAQLAGRYSEAIKRYQTVRLQGDIPAGVAVAQEIREAYARAAEDAMFWMGVCQFELAENDAALATFRDYLDRYRRGTWRMQCHVLMARLHADEGSFSRAVEEMQRAVEAAKEDEVRDPAVAGYELLLRRWRRRLEAEPAGP